MAEFSIPAETSARIESELAATDELLAAAYPGERAERQPVHTVYVPADSFTPDLASRWGAEALAAVKEHGGLEQLAASLGLREPAQLAELVRRKLESEPIEDLRLDFEDGYGHRPDAEEDAAAESAGRLVAEAVAAGTAPPFIGIRFKCFEAPTRARGLRTLDLFLGSLLEHAGGVLPDGLVLTLPKVSTVAQVRAMVIVCEELEHVHGLAAGRLRFEVQMETPQLILAADGTVPVAQLIHAGAGRVSSLHYGTYDYSASLGIAAAYQSMEHPAADYAKSVMQVAVAGTGVHLSDGSTNILPLGDAENVAVAWALHARLVRRHLERGIYQGWDLHAAQLPTRFLATYAFYRDGFEAAATRLKNYVHRIPSAIMDEPATARALARFIHRGLVCGAVEEAEFIRLADVSPAQLAALAHSHTTTEDQR
ncbi:HpcH/HpaI aldolase/citrate lyase family protein [Arthrobacter sp. Marseille-P9274]|uniref:HpcH/HpaI aldolase/citrate lyase family protein n=1 Tax=Arthrobacter sp. Marseille-P9274 TaxID=2866572 RepID=UPI0021CA7C32|nr:HpcH/HpaI aldolase/citrate lyase family protein [Arthrobacter sp. Marseille-P9274]